MDPILALIAELYTKVSHLSAENADLRKRLEADMADPVELAD